MFNKDVGAYSSNELRSMCTTRIEERPIVKHRKNSKTALWAKKGFIERKALLKKKKRRY